MKCVCGYDSEQDEDIEEPSRKEEFVQVKGTFYRDNDGYFSSMKEATLYACPECGTIKLSKWDE